MKDQNNVSLFTGDLEDATYRKLRKKELIQIIVKKGWSTADTDALMRVSKDNLIHLAKTLHLSIILFF